MSKSAKTGIAIIIIIVIILIVWLSKGNSTPNPSQTQQTNVETNSAPTADANPYGLSPLTDLTDSGIDQDVGAVDTQLSGLDTDSASIDQSLTAATVTSL